MNEVLLAAGIGVLGFSGLWLMLKARTFDVVLGLTLLSYGVNLFLFAMGRLAVDRAPIIDASRAADLSAYADPLPQALVLTAIVIGFGMTALLLVLAMAARTDSGTDHVDGVER